MEQPSAWQLEADYQRTHQAGAAEECQADTLSPEAELRKAILNLQVSSSVVRDSSASPPGISFVTHPILATHLWSELTVLPISLHHPRYELCFVCPMRKRLDHTWCDLYQLGVLELHNPWLV